MKTTFLVILCFCLSCNLSDEPLSQIRDTEGLKDTGENMRDLGADIAADLVRVEQIPPTAFEFLPNPGSVGITKTTKISFRVDKQIDVESLSTESFFLQNQKDEVIQSDVFYDSSTRTLILTPTLPLSLLETYTASFTEQITDLVGTPILGNTWSFTISDGSWTSHTLLETDVGRSVDPKVATDSTGRAAVAWAQNVGGIYRIMASRFEQEQGWTESTAIGDNNRSAREPVLLFDATGQIVVAWKQTSEDAAVPESAWANRFNTMWSIPQQIDTFYVRDIALASDEKGNTTAFWFSLRGESVHAVSRRLEIDTWTSTIELKKFAIPAFEPILAMGGNGNGMAGWREDSMVRIAPFVDGEGWGIPQERTPTGARDPQISMNKKGDATLVWRSSDLDGNNGVDLWARQFAGGEWSEPYRIVDNMGSDSVSTPRVHTNEEGEACVVWYQRDSMFASRLESGNWTSPELLDDSARPRNPAVKIDARGNALVVWESIGSLTVKRYTKNEGWVNALKIEEGEAADLALTQSGGAILVWESPEGISTTRFE